LFTAAHGPPRLQRGTGRTGPVVASDAPASAPCTALPAASGPRACALSLAAPAEAASGLRSLTGPRLVTWSTTRPWASAIGLRLALSHGDLSIGLETRRDTGDHSVAITTLRARPGGSPADIWGLGGQTRRRSRWGQGHDQTFPPPARVTCHAGALACHGHRVSRASGQALESTDTSPAPPSSPSLPGRLGLPGR
jgi:hypothetical protein